MSCNDEQSATPSDTDTFVKFFGASNTDISQMSQSTPDGGSIILGTTEIEIEGVESTKIKVIKVDRNGNEIWQKIYPPFKADKIHLETSYTGRAIVVVDDGYIIVGDSIKSDADINTSSLLVMKLNDNPTEDTPTILAIDHINNLQVSTDMGLQGIDITMDTDGNYRVIGNVINDDEEIVGSWLGTINDNGTTLSFDKTIDCYYDIEGEVELVKSLYETTSGDFIFGGTDKSQSKDNTKLFRTPACQNGFSGGGTSLVDNPQDDYITGQIIPSKGGYAMVGTKTSIAGSNIFFSLFESDGVPKPNSLVDYMDDNKQFPGIGDADEFGQTIAKTSDGGYIIGGYTLSETAGEEDMLLIKTDAFGGIQWTKVIGNIDQEEVIHIRQAEDGGYYVLGNSEFGGVDTMVLIKTDKNGNVD